MNSAATSSRNLFILFFAAFFVFIAMNVLVAYLVDIGAKDIALGVAGVVVAQFGLPLLWVVFGRMRFPLRFTIGFVYSLLSAATIFIATTVVREGGGTNHFALMAVFLLLGALTGFCCAQAPVWIFRLLSGWNLTASREESVSPLRIGQFRLGEILFMTAVAGAYFAGARYCYREMDDFLIDNLSGIAVFTATYGLFVFLPCLSILRTERPFRCLGMLAAYGTLIAVVLGVASTPHFDRYRGIFYHFFGVVVTLLILLGIVRGFGFPSARRRHA